MTACREWQASRTTAGYGHRYVRGTGRANRRQEYIHRWVWEQINGPIPAGMHVLHRCDNKPCFRYDHLYLGTDADNTLDKMWRGTNGTTKLTPDQVREIRQRSGSSYIVAREYGVGSTCIQKIRNGGTWSWLPD